MGCARLAGLLNSGPGSTEQLPSHHCLGGTPKAAEAEGREVLEGRELEPPFNAATSTEPCQELVASRCASEGVGI